MKRIPALFVIFPAILLLAVSCIKEEFSVEKLDTSLEIETTLATPVGYFEYQVFENLLVFPVKDTLSANLGKLNFPVDEDINKLVFKLYYENTIPADIDFQIYLADQNYSVIDTFVISSGSIKSPGMSESNEVVPEPAIGQIETELEGSRLENFRAGRYLIGEAFIAPSTSDTDITFSNPRTLRLNLGVIFDIDTNIEDI